MTRHATPRETYALQGVYLQASSSFSEYSNTGESFEEFGRLPHPQLGDASLYVPGDAGTSRDDVLRIPRIEWVTLESNTGPALSLKGTLGKWSE